MPDQISSEAMRTIRLEAAHAALDVSGFNHFSEHERKFIDAAVDHAFEHALEEGIIITPPPLRGELPTPMSAETLEQALARFDEPPKVYDQEVDG